MSGEDSSYQAYTARKAARLSRPKLDCGCPNDGPVYAHLWCDRLACHDHADDVHDCSAFGGAKSGTEKQPEPVVLPPGELTDEEFLEALDGDAFRAELAAALDEHAADLAHLQGEPRYRCRGCRLWIAQDVKLCGPCSVLPSCPAERSAAEWGGLVACFRPAGHDGQHESVRGRCWMDEPRAEVTVMTHEQAAAATLRHATRSLECGALTVSLRCSGCDGQAMEGGGRCLHDCHEADAPPVDAAPDPDPVTPRRRVAELYAALKARRTRRGGTT